MTGSGSVWILSSDSLLVPQIRTPKIFQTRKHNRMYRQPIVSGADELSNKNRRNIEIPVNVPYFQEKRKLIPKSRFLVSPCIRTYHTYHVFFFFFVQFVWSVVLKPELCCAKHEVKLWIFSNFSITFGKHEFVFHVWLRTHIVFLIFFFFWINKNTVIRNG